MSLPLCRVKNELTRQKFEQQYTTAVQRTLDNYYNEEGDSQARYEYYTNLVVENGQPSQESLRQLISSTYQHAKRRINLFPFVDRREDGTLKCCYSNKLLETEDCTRLVKCNEEHALPQSWHAGSSSSIGADMHLIFACATSANSFRGNIPLGFGGTVFREGKIYELENGRKVYHPNCNVGAIARAILYALFMYPHQVHANCLPVESIDWLVYVAKTEEVSLWEKHRNASLFQLQRNRNPFVDFPEWVSCFNFAEFAYSNGKISKIQRKEERMRKKLQAQLIRKEKKLQRQRIREEKRVERKSKNNDQEFGNRCDFTYKL